MEAARRLVEDTGRAAEVDAEGGGMFLTDIELRELTGYAHRSRQVAQLRRQGIAFWLSAGGRPIVARALFEGGKSPAPQKKTWEPAWAGNHR